LGTDERACEDRTGLILPAAVHRLEDSLLIVLGKPGPR
jgi:hypothetical protein